MPESDISGTGFNIEAGPDYPFSSSSPVNGGSMGGMLGVNQLQSAIDRFDAAVDKLAALYSKASGGGLPGQQNGSTSANTNGGGSRFSGQLGFAGAAYTAVSGRPVPLGLKPSTWGGGGTGQGFMGQASFGGQGGSQGGAGAPPGMGVAGGGGGLSPGKLGTLGFAEMLGSVATFGKASLQTQLGMSSMIQQGMLQAPNNVSVNAGGAQIRAAAFGTGPGRYNTMATSSMDAMAGYSTIAQASGSYNLRGGLAQGMMGAAQGLTYANPGMGFGQAAAIGQQIFSPQTALRMQMMGYGTTGRTMGGGPPGTFQAIIQGQMQRMYQGRGSINPQQLAKNLAPGNIANIDVSQATGLQGQDLQNYISTMEAYNKVTFSGKTYNQAASLFAQASKGNKSARSQLSKLGISETEQQRIQDVGATKTGGQSDIYNSFNSGMTTATASMNAFNNAINQFLQSPAGQALGYGAGAAGGLSTGNASSMLQGGGGIAMMLAAKRMSGMAAGAGGAVPGAGGAAGAGGAGGLAAMLAPAMVAGGGLLAGAFLKGVGDSMAPAGSGAGQNNKVIQNTHALPMGMGFLSGFAAKGMSLLSGFSKGGVTPGYEPGRDTMTIAVGGGEGILVPEAVQGIGGPSAIDSINAKFAGHRGAGKGGQRGHYAAGGTIPYLGTTLPPESTMVKYFGPMNSSANETTVPFAGHSVQINKALAGNVRAMGAEVQSAGFSKYIRDVGGFRTVKGGSGSPIPFSMHQFGAAIDINEDGGPNGNWNTMTLDSKLVSIMKKYHWFNGQSWHGSSRDGGHFQYTGGTVAGATPKGGGGGGGGSGGSGGGAGTSAPSSTTGMGNMPGGGGYNDTSEAANVAAALGGGTGGSGPSGGGTTTNAASAANAAHGSTTNGAGSGSKGKGKGSPNTSSITGGGTKAQNRVLMKKMAAAYGWGSGQQWAALDWLEMAEAGYNNRIWNGSGSGAYGMPQALPYSKMPKAAWPESAGGKSDPKTQIDWMLHYIKTSGNFHDPISAKAFHLSHNWYGEGTKNAKRGPAIVGERGPEAVFMQGGETVLNAKQTAQAPWKAKNVAETGGSNSCSGNHGVSLNFGAGSVVIGGGSGSGSVSATSNSAREFVKQVKELLGKENLYEAIASGQKGG